jgi:sec-independent protein translocase protein TatA
MEGIFAPWHIVIVLIVALLVFGPKRLPEMGHSLGKSITSFRQGLQDAKDELSGVMKGTESSGSAQTDVCDSPPPGTRAPAVVPEPEGAIVATDEKPTEPSTKV